MTTVVLLVLALAWGAVLFFWFRSRAQGSFSDSVGLFHRHLHVLERAAPGTLAPANRLRSQPAPFGTIRPIRDVPVRHPQALRGRPAQRTSGAQVVAAARRRQTLRRRRDVLFVLAILTVATFVVAAVTRGPNAITAQILCDFMLGSYVALLVRIRNLAAERELKLRPIDRSPAPTAVRRSRPAARRPLAAGYAMASGYDALEGYAPGGYAVGSY